MKQETSHKVKSSNEESQNNNLDILPDLPKGSSYSCRISVDGKVVEGHWVNRAKGLPTMDNGFKFIFTKDSTGFIVVKNLDYGWVREEVRVDEKGVPFDTVEQNAQGFDFDNEKFVDIEAAYEAAVSWLVAREKIRNS